MISLYLGRKQLAAYPISLAIYLHLCEREAVYQENQHARLL